MEEVLEKKVFDVEKIRGDFPILDRKVKDRPLVYLDNAATAQKPKQVIEAIEHYYRYQNSNVHRGIHSLSEEATRVYEDSRDYIKNYLNAAKREEIIFTKGCTEGINLVAQSFGRNFFKKGDEVIISAMEHHANIVPWQILRDQIGISIRILPMNNKGELEIDQLPELINDKTRLIAVVHYSNTLGTINPVKNITEIAHERDIPVLIDGAQAMAHGQFDVQDLDCDFYTFSGHKLFGPTGIGVLYGKEKYLEQMPPYQGGGDMIETVTFEKTTFNNLPYKFEAGTPNMAGAVGLASAMDYVTQIGWDKLVAQEQRLLKYATEKLGAIEGLRIIGEADEKTSVVSFHFDDIHPQDMGILLDQNGIAIRTGHHCTQPIMRFFDIPATSRASFAFYNTTAEIDRLIDGIEQVKTIMGV